MSWPEAMAAFERWTGLSPPEREPFLNSLDAEVRRKVERLIQAEREAEVRSFLLTPAEMPRSLQNTRLGPWLVEKLIGAGGMGPVWLARRTDGLYDGRAAIKLMRLASQSSSANERFAQEGLLLGKLSHPNIARLLDAGVTEAGERYLVLEYVEGERIDKYCERLEPRQRIELFLSVCEAVAHAHENFIVHRDLKPSNIFVTSSGQVKLLDFGIAKLVAASGDASELTLESGVVLTPEYAAPEQLNAGAITTATDVYGLGMVLRHLLPKPLQGDLAIVAGKATRENPQERYRNALELRDELRRVLEQRAIVARPDSLLYKLRKYVQRHRLGVAAVALIVLAIAGGVVGTLLKAREAQRQAARAIAVKGFLVDLFEQARTTVHGGMQARDATLNDLLVAGTQRVDRFASQPEVRDEIFEMLIDLYVDTGEQKQVLDLARRRLELAKQSFGESDPRAVPAYVQLAGVDLAFGQMAEVPALLSQAQAILDRARDDSSFTRAQLLRWQGTYDYVLNNKPPWPENKLVRAAKLLREKHPDQVDELISTLGTLASVACKYGNAEEAMVIADEFRQRTVAAHGADNLYVDEAQALVAQFGMYAGNAAPGVPMLRQSIEGMKRHVGPKSPDVVATQFLLAEALLASGHPEESAQVMQEQKEAIAREHPDDQSLIEQQAIAGKHLQQIREGKPHSCTNP